MKPLEMWSVYDFKTENFDAPVFSHNVMTVTRQFETELKRNPDSVYVRHMDDFSLCFVGHFVPETGIVTPVKDPLAQSVSFRAILQALPEQSEE